MNKTCYLLRKSFYEDEWKLVSFGAETWVRQKDGLELWGSNGWPFFTGYKNNIHIPLHMRWYMARQIRKGQNILATEKYLQG